VDTGTHLDPKLAHAANDVLGTTDRASRTIEPHVEAVAGRVLLVALVAREELADDRMMALDEPLPGCVANPRLVTCFQRSTCPAS
jgi:hypothetical protein